jgi:16S rRNA G966 N2-methylase RsmD
MSTKLAKTNHRSPIILYKLLIDSLLKKGIVKTAKSTGIYAYELIYNSIRERQFKIETKGVIERSTLGYDNPVYNYYVPTPYSTLFKIFRQIKETIPEGTFIDYGSGMGRVLIVASTYSFRKVIGIELSHDLNNIAKDNVKKSISKLRCKNIDIIEADAKTYFPPKHITHFFLFNPFGNEILKCVLNNIHDSLIDNPRDVIIIYLPPNTNQETIVDECKWLLKSDEKYYFPGIDRRVVRFYTNLH